MLTTNDLLSSTRTLYKGPSSDRYPLGKAVQKGKVSFVVCRSHIGLPLGQNTTLGSYPSIEEANQALTDHPEFTTISACYPGFGFTDECPVYHSKRNLL